MIKCLVNECNANVNGESSVVVGLRSFLNNKTSQSFKQAFFLNLHNCHQF